MANQRWVVIQHPEDPVCRVIFNLYRGVFAGMFTPGKVSVSPASLDSWDVRWIFIRAEQPCVPTRFVASIGKDMLIMTTPD